MHLTTLDRRSLARAVAVGGLVAALAIPPATLAGNGNNGTVKIHDGAVESPADTANDPKVGCVFHLHFMFGDADQAGSWEIRSWPDGGVVDAGGYAAVDGEAFAIATVPSAGLYKLFWDGDTGKHDKHKVFKSDCDDNGGGESVDQ